MPYPVNGIFIVTSEVNSVVTAIKRSSHWISHAHQSEDEKEQSLKTFFDLKDLLLRFNNVNDLDPVLYLTPFLNVIRSETTNSQVTAAGLSAIYKFLSYGLIDVKHAVAAAAAENIADAVTHARFVGTDTSSDEVVLMKIIHVLRLLLLTPLGTLLTNDSVCEIMQSCFRICFENRLSELLRRTAESALMDMVQLLFSCLPQFTEDARYIHMKKLKMRSGVLDAGYTKKKHHFSKSKSVTQSCVDPNSVEKPIFTSPVDSVTSELSDNSNTAASSDVKEHIADLPSAPVLDNSVSDDSLTVKNVDMSAIETEGVNNCDSKISDTPIQVSSVLHSSDDEIEFIPKIETSDSKNKLSDSVDVSDETSGITSDIFDDVSTIDPNSIDYINPRGVRFTPHEPVKDGSSPLIPYGLPCVRELFRYLACLINPLDRHNTDAMLQVGLHLIITALEAGADNIGKFNSLLLLIKDETCRNLFALLSSDRLAEFSASLRACFLMFESLRTHLKFQFEMFVAAVMEMIVSESPKITYEKREMCVDCVTLLLRIPGLATEMYINYDCDLYCSNLFEELIRLLSKNVFTLSGLCTVHLLSMDALFAIIDTVEDHCHYRVLIETASRSLSYKDEAASDDAETVTDISELSEPVTLYQGASGYLVSQQFPFDRPEKPASSPPDYQYGKRLINILPNRMCVKMSAMVPNQEELSTIKRKKKILTTGTEQFNIHPSKGIQFLQEHGILKTPLDPDEVAAFLRDNPQLDKKMIGEYISNRKNLKILQAFVRSFSFENMRIDEALRHYLETFRLPGEAPLISLLMEHFAEQWHKSNNEPFANNDAAFTLAYAVIMLNVDQHNFNVKKQGNPMTLEDFKKNLKNVNGGADFDENMLDEIYASIKSEEIVMPAEQTGLVKENYMWKVLLRRGNSKDGKFLHVPTGVTDRDLFSLTWGPTVSALSSIFDKSIEPPAADKTISGFYKCAVIAAHYEMSDVFDNIIISLCKFTTLMNSTENPKNIPVSFGNSVKSQIATKALFMLTHRYGDILREGWKNLIDCVLQLYKAKLLPKEMVEVEDFVSSSGFISLIREDLSTIPRNESGIFSSFYSYIISTSDNPSQRPLTQEDEAAKQAAIDCITSCHCDQLFTESKFLRMEALLELIKAIILSTHVPKNSDTQGMFVDEDKTVFLLEMLMKIVLLNRDRIMNFWMDVQDHLVNLIIGATVSDKAFLFERAVVGLLRVTIRLVRKEETIPRGIQLLELLLYIRPLMLDVVTRQIAFALHELLRTSAANIHLQTHWFIIFSLFEQIGAGAKYQPSLTVTDSEISAKAVEFSKLTGAQSDSQLNNGHWAEKAGGDTERRWTSDSDLYDSQQKFISENILNNLDKVDWVMLEKKSCETEPSTMHFSPAGEYNIIWGRELLPHDALAFLKCCESLAFLIRDVAHITAENIESCVHCIGFFVEASANGGSSYDKKISKSKLSKERKVQKRPREEKIKRHRSYQTLSNKVLDDYDVDDDDKSELASTYQQVSLQLLDLMHTLHTRASSIFGHSNHFEAGNEKNIQTDILWKNCWCPLLQGIARLCCDARRVIRTSALTLLPRALLVHDLKTLSPAEWESCFNKVLFPLLSKLLQNISPNDPQGMEETRMRGATLLCKVFLQHLSPLLTLPTFMALWLTILDFMDKYMRADRSGLLAEAIPESLKNMLLVMETAGIFQYPDDSSSTEQKQMWVITWDRINAFLPNLKEELFKPAPLPLPPPPVNSVVRSNSDNENSLNDEEMPQVPNNVSNVISKENCDAVQEQQENVSVDMSTSLPIETPQTPVETSSYTASSVILHPPVSPLTYSTINTPGYRNCVTFSSASTDTISSPVAVPLLLNPSVIDHAAMQMFTSQASSANPSESPR